jgi:methyltransferase
VTVPGTGAGVAAALAVLIASRLVELRRSAKNARSLRARGGHPDRGDLFPALAALHAAFLVALPLEVWAARTGPSALWPLWLGLWACGEGIRVASIRALGDRWTVGVHVVPGEPRSRRGPYRILRHPNYLGVALELAAVPLLFGAWRTALVASAANAVLLALRIRHEERALADAEGAGRIEPAPSRAKLTRRPVAR